MPNFKNTTRNKIVTGSTGNDSIINAARGATLNGGSGGDTISTFGNSIRADGGDGSDSIRSTGGSRVTLHGGFGNDTLTGSSSAEVFEFRADEDHDVITNFDTNDSIFITDGSLQSYYVDEDDLIVSIEGAADSGSIRLLNAADIPIKLKIGTGNLQTINNDIIKDVFNRKRKKTVNGSKKRDYIFNYAESVTVNAGASNDTIANYGNSVSISGGAGNDSIRNLNGSFVTIHGGAGNDTIISSNEHYGVFQFRADGGDDLVYNFRASLDTLDILEGELNSCYVDENDLIVVIQDESNVGTVRLKNHADSSIRIRHADGSSGTIKAFNHISINRASVVANGTAGNDFITDTYSSVTILADDGNDRIYSNSSYNSILGGAGNDSIYGTYSRSTVNAGKGNDTIAGGYGGNVYQFRADDGNDLIVNFKSSDMIQLTSELTASHYFDGDDIIFNFTENGNSSGSITLKDVVNIPIRVWQANGIIATINNHNDIVNGTNSTLIGGTDERDSIFNNVQNVSIEAGDGNDTILNTAYYVDIKSGGGNDSIRSNSYSIIDGGTGNDLIDGNDGAYISINAGDGDDYVFDFRYSTVRGGEGIDTLIGSGNNVFQFGATDERALIKNFSTSDTLQIIDGSIKSHFTAGDDYIVKVRGANNSGVVTLDGAAHTLIKVLDASGSLGAFGYDIANWTAGRELTGTSAIDLIFNAADYVTINSGAGNDLVDSGDTEYVKINGGAGADSIRIHQQSTVNGGKGNDTITGSSLGHNVYQFGSDGGADLITSFSRYDTLQITAGAIVSYASSGDDYVISVKGSKYGGTVTLGGAASDPMDPLFVKTTSGRVNVINFAVYNSKSNTMLSGTSNSDKIYNEGNRVTLNAGAGNDSIRNIADYVMLDGGDGKDSIYAYDLDYGSIAGGKGNDTIIGSGHYSTFEGGAGNDLIGVAGGNNVYRFGAADGKDTIRNFTPSDQIQLTSGEIVGHSLNGGDYVVQVSNGRSTGYVTLQGTAWTPIRIRDTLDAVSTINSFNVITNASGGAIVTGSSNRDSIYNSGSRATINADDGNDAIFNFSNYVRINAGGGDDSVRSYQYATVNGGAGNDSIDAYYSGYYNKYQSLNGGSGDDYIYNFQYSTVRGGAGDDTLAAYAGHNLYQFGAADGNDLITNFVAANDTIQIIDGEITSHYQAASDYVIEVDGLASIVVKGAAASAIKVKTADDTLTTLNSGNSELPAADYWFEQDSAIEDPIDEIIAKDAEINLQFDQLRETFKPKLDLISSSARKNMQR